MNKPKDNRELCPHCKGKNSDKCKMCYGTSLPAALAAAELEAGPTPGDGDGGTGQ